MFTEAKPLLVCSPRDRPPPSSTCLAILGMQGAGISLGSFIPATSRVTSGEQGADSAVSPLPPRSRVLPSVNPAGGRVHTYPPHDPRSLPPGHN